MNCARKIDFEITRILCGGNAERQKKINFKKKYRLKNPKMKEKRLMMD